jgi:exopolysaccharide biosynthesis polyprenyl glycosylphosphotransferase
MNDVTDTSPSPEPFVYGERGREEHPGAGRTAAVGPDRSRRRTRVAIEVRRSVGRAVLVWLVAYATLRSGADVFGAAARAAAVTAIFVPFIERSTTTTRVLPASFGALAIPALGAAWGTAALSCAALWVPALELDRAAVAIIGGFGFLLVMLWDVFARRAANSPVRLLVIGSGDWLERLVADLMTPEAKARFRLIAVATDQPMRELRLGGVRFSPLADIDGLVSEVEPELVVVAVERGRPEVFERLLSVAGQQFNVVGLPEFYEVAFGRLPIRVITPAWFMSTLHLYNRPYNRLAKRLFDLVVATVGVIVTLPLYVPIAAIVKRTPGPLFFRQRRLGENGVPFEIVKFRSMREGSELPGIAQWAAQDDARVIPGGSSLRKWRLDELPQLWNVLRGEMSIVGPRPERPEFLEQLEREVPFWKHRDLLKPGITGWAQIRSGYAADELGAEEKLSFDLWYLRHRSLLLDAVIAMRTARTVLLRAGSR